MPGLHGLVNGGSRGLGLLGGLRLLLQEIELVANVPVQLLVAGLGVLVLGIHEDLPSGVMVVEVANDHANELLAVICRVGWQSSGSLGEVECCGSSLFFVGQLAFFPLVVVDVLDDLDFGRFG